MWFNYIERAHSTCRTILNEECSRRVHEFFGLDFTATMACMENSFTAPKANWEKSTCKNSIIDEEITYWKEFGTNIYPSIVIN